MCYFTPTEWRCGHLSYAKVPCRQVQTFKDKGLSCPYNTTLGTLWRNRSCGDTRACAQARVEALQANHHVRHRVRALDSQETLVPSVNGDR